MGLQSLISPPFAIAFLVTDFNFVTESLNESEDEIL